MRFRHQVPERKLFKLAAQALHAHAPGQRAVDFEGLLRDARPLVCRHEAERAHVVQAIGQLDQQDAHVVGDRQQQFAEILGLLRRL